LAGKRFWQKWESKRRADRSPGSAAKLLLRFLLTDRAVEAVKIYEELHERERQVDLREWFERRDYMDCMFLLAEEYERAGRLEAAVEHYRAVHRGGGDGYLGEEVRLRMRNLLLKSLPRKARGAEARKWYERAIQMGLSKSDRAFAYKKMAECSARMGMEDEGREMLRRAFELKPTLKGAKRICRVLGFEAGMVQGAFTGGKCR
jgi:tetratricopeptide (TPR) repeat protein